MRGVADVVMFFSPYASPACGTAPMDNWNANGRHAFVPNANGLDLDGADSYYAALIAIGSSCPAVTAVHEFGHLFGAGHAFSGNNPAPPGFYLLPKNHAYVFSYQGGSISGKTIMTQGGNTANQLWVFSAFPMFNMDNLAGLAYTASSVANYRTGVADYTPGPDQCSDGIDNDGNGQTDYPSDTGCAGPSDSQEYGVPETPGCSLTAPVIVSGVLTGVCAPTYPYTRHLLSWIDVCPSAKTHYQVWYNQLGTYVYGWQTPIPINSILVWDANAELKVKSCNGPTCTDPSLDSYCALSAC